MSTMRGALQIAPPGRWWDNDEFARSLELKPTQQKRMDGIFDANRSILVVSFQRLQQEETTLEGLTHGAILDETKIFQQIDRVAQARAALEKSNAHMLLDIRKEMTPEQAARLDEHRPPLR